MWKGNIKAIRGAPHPSGARPGCPHYKVISLDTGHLCSGNWITESQNHRMLGVGRDSMGHLVQAPCRSRVSYSRLHRTLSRWVLNISREGDSITSLGNLFQCPVTLRLKKLFLMFNWIKRLQRYSAIRQFSPAEKGTMECKAETYADL